MKRLLFLLLTGLFAQLIVSCYPEGANNTDEMDVAITSYDKSADFSSYSTFSMPDSIVYFTQKSESITGDHQFDKSILKLVADNFTQMGYTKIAGSATDKPDFLVTVSAITNVNYYYSSSNWYNYWGWYPGWDWYGWNWPNNSFSPYYPWYPVVYSYRTGSVIIEMFDTKNVVPTTAKLPVLWTGIADGLLSGSDAFILSRVEAELNQCFVQSPYLKQTNK